MKDKAPVVSQKVEKRIEGMVNKLNQERYRYESGYYIVLFKQQLSVYEGDSKESELLHQFSFPHGAEYRFIYN